MSEPKKKENQSSFKEKFKLNPFSKELAIKHLIKAAMHKKNSRELMIRVYEKNGVLKEMQEQQAKNLKTYDSVPTQYNEKSLEQVLR